LTQTTTEAFDTKASLTSRTATYSSSRIMNTKDQQFNSKYKSLMNHVLEKSRVDELKKHQDFFKKESGKFDFISKFKEIKKDVRENTLKPTRQNNSINYLSSYNTAGNFLTGNVSKQLFIKKNVDQLFPKKREPIFSSFKTPEPKDNKLTVNSSKENT
jgi:hypothetical protein